MIFVALADRKPSQVLTFVPVAERASQCTFALWAGWRRRGLGYFRCLQWEVRRPNDERLGPGEYWIKKAWPIHKQIWKWNLESSLTCYSCYLAKTHSLNTIRCPWFAILITWLSDCSMRLAPIITSIAANMSSIWMAWVWMPACAPPWKIKWLWRHQN